MHRIALFYILPQFITNIITRTLEINDTIIYMEQTAWTNSADQEQFDQGLHCFPFRLHWLHQSWTSDSKTTNSYFFIFFFYSKQKLQSKLIFKLTLFGFNVLLKYNRSIADQKDKQTGKIIMTPQEIGHPVRNRSITCTTVTLQQSQGHWNLISYLTSPSDISR